MKLFDLSAERNKVCWTFSFDRGGRYHGTAVDQAADPALYERVLDGFPEALVEDPKLDEATQPLSADHEARVTWDCPIRGVETADPHHTTQECSVCGSIGARDGDYFSCSECVRGRHADLNVSENIAQ